MNKQGQISTCPQISKTHSNMHFIEKLTSLRTGKILKFQTNYIFPSSCRKFCIIRKDAFAVIQIYKNRGTEFN